VSPEGAAARNTREPESAAPLATVHGADELTYFRLRRLLGGIGLRAELVSGPPATGGARGTPVIAVVIASGPTDANAARRCDVEMVVLTATPSETGAREALELGAIGYLPLHLEDATLSKALGAIVAGEAGFSRTVLGQWLRSRNGYIRPSDAPQLTQRQRQILERIARGEADKQIAQHLGIATATVQKHVQLLLRRLQVPNRAGAVRYARVARTEEPT
jgi:DNA-binding CsgD family transcriptional regulator